MRWEALRQSRKNSKAPFRYFQNVGGAKSREINNKSKLTGCHFSPTLPTSWVGEK